MFFASIRLKGLNKWINRQITIGAELNRDGFTLVELVVVIALWAMLALLAIPRLLDMRDTAHKSSVQATAGALSSAVKLANTAWIVAGNRSGSSITDPATRGKTVNMNGDIVTFNGLGWPECSRSYPRVRGRCGNGSINSSNRECDSVAKALLHTSYSIAYYRDYTDEDFLAFEPGETDRCQYTYAPSFDMADVTSDLCILYNTNDGSVSFLEGINCSREHTP